MFFSCRLPKPVSSELQILLLTMANDTYLVSVICCGQMIAIMIVFLFRNQDLCFLHCHTAIIRLSTVLLVAVTVFRPCLDATIHIQFLQQPFLAHQEDPHQCQICFHLMILDHCSRQCHEQGSWTM